MAPIFFLLLSVLLATVLHLARSRTRPSPTCSLPHGSLGWPFLGETLEFISAAYSARPESFMNRRRLLYGNVFKSHIFGSPTIVSTDAEVSRFVLQSDARAFVASYPKSLSELMGESSILLINGSLQRRVHGLIGAFFKSPQLKSQITADMQVYVRRRMATWRDTTQPILIQNHTKHIVFQILIKGLIGLEPGEEMDFLKREFQQFIAGLMSLPLKLPGTRLYRSLQAKKRMVMLVKRIIEEKRRRNESCGFRPNSKDVVDVLINDTSGHLTDELISDNMIDLMIPAEDSVPVLITLAVKYLGESPLALRQLEVTQSLGLMAHLGVALDEWNTEFVKIKYLRGEYERMMNAKAKEVATLEGQLTECRAELANMSTSLSLRCQEAERARDELIGVRAETRQKEKKIKALAADKKALQDRLSKKEHRMSEAEASEIASKAVEDFKNSLAYRGPIEDFIQEARNHIFDVEVKDLERQCLEEGFIRGFLKGIRAVHRKTGVRIEDISPSQASEDPSPDLEDEGVVSRLQGASPSDDENIDIM